MIVGMKMPDLAATEAQIKVVEWLVQVGDGVERGQPLVQVETDKAAMEVESIAAGVLAEIRAQPEEEVEVGAVIARIEVAGSAPAAAPPAAPPPPAAAEPAAAAGAAPTPAPSVASGKKGGIFARNRAARKENSETDNG